MIVVVGYILAVLVGISLGLLGGGGAIIIIPVLVYIFKKDVVEATSYSLFIVFISALIGSILNASKRAVNFKLALVFGIPDIISMYCVRRFVIPEIPMELFAYHNTVFTRDAAILILFSIIIMIASYNMIFGKKAVPDDVSRSNDINLFKLASKGLLTGCLTGLIGIGGGFLIVPSLVLLAGVSIKEAVVTSLIIIMLKSGIGFIGDLQSALEIEWNFLLSFSLLAIIGILIGNRLSSNLSNKNLKRVFGYFALSMAILIVVKELLSL